jgi:hypothetical protein
VGVGGSDVPMEDPFDLDVYRVSFKAYDTAHPSSKPPSPHQASRPRLHLAVTRTAVLLMAKASPVSAPSAEGADSHTVIDYDAAAIIILKRKFSGVTDSICSAMLNLHEWPDPASCPVRDSHLPLGFL